MPTSDTYNYGWKEEYEEKHSNDLASICCAQGHVPIASLGEANIPPNMDFEWFTQNDQLGWPFCHAHMRTGMEEILYYLATQGKIQNFSRYYAAITDMRMDGDDSRPEGASIGGSLRSAVKDGAAIETLMPYPPYNPRNYSNKIPANVKEDALSRHIKSLITGIRSYDDVDRLLTSGRGVVGLGFNWTQGWANIRGYDAVKQVPGGRILGGHALFLAGWKTIGNRRCPILHNSHDGWGVKRRAALFPEVVDYLIKTSRYGAFGATTIELGDKDPKPQPWDWVKGANFASGQVDPFAKVGQSA